MSRTLLACSVSCVLGPILAVGCAVGEPIDSLERELELELAVEAPAAVRAEFIVEVTDRGRPVVADSVFAWNGGLQAGDAHCMIHAGLGRCATWFVELESTGPMTLFAELCGELYAQPLALALQPSTEAFTFSSHVTIEADATACGRVLPLACDGEAFADPALSITVLDTDGNPAAVRGLSVRHDDHPAAPADCLEGYGHGCSEWASQHTNPGRYRAEVDVCGQSYDSGWVTVTADDSGCKAIAQAVTIVVGKGACDYRG